MKKSTIRSGGTRPAGEFCALGVLTQEATSGHYAQCHGTLFDGQGYCCLGVYAHAVLGIKTIYPRFTQEPAYIAMRDDIPRVEMERFWRLNDGDNLTFPQIAEVIKQDYHL